MARSDSSFRPSRFVEEIDFNEIETLEVVGKGSFGIVRKGRWRDRLVAIKHIEGEEEKKAFATEKNQLSRVSHPNIIQLYGACTIDPVCLVMEYAEGGSLYNVLHGRPAPRYTAGHAISWALQCARGVEYLHNMKPPLIHRDLKPPNLLLVNSGTVLKICDFGTACDKKTYMTNNKGSAAWMAPEVFEGRNYTEKCDVFSWSIILWEVLSRQKPFDDIGGSAYRIMWAVHTGRRPPLLNGCPPVIEKLMTSCWEQDPRQRPSITLVRATMEDLLTMFTDYEQPVQYSDEDEDEFGESGEDLIDDGIEYSEYPSSHDIFHEELPSRVLREIPEARWDDVDPRYSRPIRLDIGPEGWVEGSQSSERASQFLPQAEIPSFANQGSFTYGDQTSSYPGAAGRNPGDPGAKTLEEIYMFMDPELQPIQPDPDCEESMKIFEEHKKMAREYLETETEMTYLNQYLQQLTEQLGAAEQEEQQVEQLTREKESLEQLQVNLSRQLELLQRDRPDGWVVLPREGPRLT